jgi:hypothetical protein
VKRRIRKVGRLVQCYRDQGLCDHGAIIDRCNRCKPTSKTIESKLDYGRTFFQQSEQWKEDSKNRAGSLGKSRPMYNKAAWKEGKAAWKDPK